MSIVSNAAIWQHKQKNKNDMKKATLRQIIDALIDNNYYDLYDSLADNGLESQQLFDELSQTEDLERAMKILRREAVSHITN